MCTCTCKTGALLLHGGAVLSLAAWTYMVQQSLCICVCGQRARCSLFVCMEPIQSVQDPIAAGAICLPCCITGVPAAPQGACWGFAPLLSCCLASFPFLSLFFSLPWQCRLVEKAKQQVSEALQCKQTSSNWTLTGKISAAVWPSQDVWAARKDCQAGEEPEGREELSSLTMTVFVRSRLKLICELALKC